MLIQSHLLLGSPIAAGHRVQIVEREPNRDTNGSCDNGKRIQLSAKSS